MLMLLLTVCIMLAMEHQQLLNVLDVMLERQEL